ncbi:hypothetical protein HFN89_07005 [Rhizobium laguerreae]|nr:hypothetical protein [Rhizobium laguerreae]
MHLNLRCQFMARAAQAKGGDIGWKKVVTTRAVEIVERNDVEAPMAFVFKEQMQKTPHYLRYDHAAGALFLRHAKGNRVEARNEHFSYDWDHPTQWMTKRSEEKFVEIFGPDSMIGFHVGFQSFHASELDGLHDVNESDLVAAEKLLAECMADFIAADGWLWKKVPEPVFHLYRNNVGWKTTLSFNPDPRIGSDRRHFHFGLHQYEEMLDWKARLSELTDRPGTADEFTSMDLYEASVDGYAIDLEFALVDLVQHFSTTSRSIGPGQHGILSLPEMPLPVLDAFCRARRILEVPRAERDEGANAEAVELLEAIPDIVEAHPDYRNLFAKPSENAFQIEKWHSRPISIVPVFGQGLAP